MTDMNSMRTRVDVVFPALHRLEREWVADLLSLATHGHPSALLAAQRCRLEPRTKEVTWGAQERSLPAPVSLLEWLIRQLEVPPRGWPAMSDDARRFREALVSRDSVVIEDALRRLRENPSVAKGWWILEGHSRPDAYLETPDAIIVVEGKRTELGPTTHTEYMTGRHQLLRHMDAAWDSRGLKKVFGLFIVEGESNGDVPLLWRDAAHATWGNAAIETSLPHRSPGERSAIAAGVLGATTWQAVVRRFGLEPALLADT